MASVVKGVMQKVQPVAKRQMSTWKSRAVRSAGPPSKSIHAVMVSFKVKKEEVKSFLELAKIDAVGSVTKEPGCLRFDIVQDAKDPTKVAFCEIYADENAFKEHQEQDHFKAFIKGKDAFIEGQESVMQCKNVFPNYGDTCWASEGEAKATDDSHFKQGSLLVVSAPLYVKPENVEEYLEAIVADAKASISEEPGCLRFDVFQNIDEKKKGELYLYEVYTNPPAFDYHCDTPHIKAWIKATEGMTEKHHEKMHEATRVIGKNVWPPDNWGWASV